MFFFNFAVTFFFEDRGKSSSGEILLSWRRKHNKSIAMHSKILIHLRLWPYFSLLLVSSTNISKLVGCSEATCETS